jgi:hypothetical protein
VLTAFLGSKYTLHLLATFGQLSDDLQHIVCDRDTLWHVRARAGTLKDALKPADHIWFAERFQVAAVKRYGRLDAACSEEVLAGARACSRRLIWLLNHMLCPYLTAPFLAPILVLCPHFPAPALAPTPRPSASPCRRPCTYR